MQQRQTGFTLIELLVVVAIIGIVTTLLTVNIGAWFHTKQPKDEAQRLKVEIQGLLDQAVISQTHLGLVVKPDEIWSYQQQEDTWQAPKTPEPSAITVSDGIKLLAPIYKQPPPTPEGEEPAQPSISIHLGTDGRMTSYRLGMEDGQTRCYLAINYAGGMQVTDCADY